jgi:hypothetical protein
VLEEAPDVLERDHVQRPPHRPHEPSTGAGGGPPQESALTLLKASSIGLRSGEYAGRNRSSQPLSSTNSLLRSPLCAPSCPGPPPARAGAQALGPARRRGLEHPRGGCPLHRDAWPHPLGAHACQQRRVVAAVARRLPVGPLTPRRPRPQWGKPGVRAALVHEDEPAQVEGCYSLALGAARSLVPLGGCHSLCL